MNPTILVTGYGGFLGTAICRWLLANGYRVRGIARQHYPEAAAAGVETLQGDLRNLQDVERACQGVDAVIHTAAIAGVWGRRFDFESINVTATQHLLNVAKKSGIHAFVYSSSPSVTFDGNPQSGIDESTPYPTRWYCDYPRTKAMAEQHVIAANEPGRMLTCSLRPHLIWGEGDPHLIPRVIQRCRSGRLRRVGSGKNLIDTVHVETAAEAHGLALAKLLDHRQEVAGKCYFITDGTPVPCWDWITMLLQGAGLTPPSRSISLRGAYAIGWLCEKTFQALGKLEEPPMTRFVALQLGVDHYFDISAARRLLGFAPQVDREQQLVRMQSWLRKVAKD